MKANDERVPVWLIYLLSISLFFLPLAINNALLTILLVYCAFTTRLKDITGNLLHNKYTQVLVLVFAAQVAGFVYTTNISSGLFMLEKKISFLLIPIFLMPALQNRGLDFNIIFKRIGEFCLYGSLVLICIALFRKFILQYEKAFYFESFRSFEGFSPIHYVYFALFFGCGSLFFIESMFSVLVKRKFGYAIIAGVFAYCTCIMILVSSKTGILAFIVASIVLLYFKMKNRKIFVVSIILILISSLALLYFNQTTRDRFLLGLKHDLSIFTVEGLPKDLEFTDLNMRLVFWKISLKHLFLDNLVLTGVGTGDVQDYIDSLFILPQYQITGYLGWNSHNQWIYTIVQLGFFGVSSLALVFFYPLYKSLRNGNVKFLIFTIFSLAFSLTEAIFEVNKGIVFFCLFLTILAASEHEAKKSKSSSLQNILR